MTEEELTKRRNELEKKGLQAFFDKLNSPEE